MMEWTVLRFVDQVYNNGLQITLIIHPAGWEEKRPVFCVPYLLLTTETDQNTLEAR